MTFLKKKPTGLINAERKISHLVAENRDLKEEIERLRGDLATAEPMYYEGSDNMIRLHEEFKQEMRSFRKWIKWRWKQ